MSKRHDGGFSSNNIDYSEPSETNFHDFSSMIDYAEFVRPLWRCAGCWLPSFITSEGSRRMGFEAGWEYLFKLAHDGWDEMETEVLDIADKAIRMIEREIEQFEPEFGVAGADVEIGRYMSGIPENMVSYPLTKVSNLGHMITVCQDLQAPNNISGDNMIARGALVAALIICLDRMGHQTELFVRDEFQVNGRREVITIKIKGSNDLIDPARIMFACAHPGVSRGFGFTLMQNLGVPRDYIENPEKQIEMFCKSGSHKRNEALQVIREQGMISYPQRTFGDMMHSRCFGEIVPLTRNMEHGTIYLPPISNTDVGANSERELRRLLSRIGLINGDEDD